MANAYKKIGLFTLLILLFSLAMFSVSAASKTRVSNVVPNLPDLVVSDIRIIGTNSQPIGSLVVGTQFKSEIDVKNIGTSPVTLDRNSLRRFLTEYKLSLGRSSISNDKLSLSVSSLTIPSGGVVTFTSKLEKISKDGHYCVNVFADSSRVVSESNDNNNMFESCFDTDAGPGGICGDGVLGNNEQCDFGDLHNNNNDLSSLRETFLLLDLPYGDNSIRTKGYRCTTSCRSKTRNVRAPYCGDKNIDKLYEICDGNVFLTLLGFGETCEGQGFPSGGRVKCNRDCTYDYSRCDGIQQICGDGVVNGNEQCDNGANNDVVCTTYGPGSSCSYCANSCSNTVVVNGGYCGDGIKNGPEFCDSTDLGSHTSCQALGFDTGNLGCQLPGTIAECRYDISMCSSCGNGRVDADEECDGSDLADKTCKSQGFDEGKIQCSSSCALDTSGCTGTKQTKKTTNNPFKFPVSQLSSSLTESPLASSLSTTVLDESHGFQTASKIIDANTIFVAKYEITTGRYILSRSRDGGIHWQDSIIDTATFDPESITYINVDALDTQTIVVAYTYILNPTHNELRVAKSIDGGDTWVKLPAVKNVEIIRRPQIKLATPEEIYLVFKEYGELGDTYFARISNSQWTVTSLKTNMDIFSFDVQGENILFAGYHFLSENVALQARYSIDKGASWSDSIISFPGYALGFNFIYSHEKVNVKIVTPQISYVYTKNFLFKTVDGWKTWTTLSVPTDFDTDRADVFAVNNNIIILVGFDLDRGVAIPSRIIGRISSDSGMTWNFLTILADTTLVESGSPVANLYASFFPRFDPLSVSIISPSQYIISTHVGFNGIYIITSSNAGQTWNIVEEAGVTTGDVSGRTQIIGIPEGSTTITQKDTSVSVKVSVDNVVPVVGLSKIVIPLLYYDNNGNFMIGYYTTKSVDLSKSGVIAEYVFENVFDDSIFQSFSNQDSICLRTYVNPRKDFLETNYFNNKVDLGCFTIKHPLTKAKIPPGNPLESTPPPLSGSPVGSLIERDFTIHSIVIGLSRVYVKYSKNYEGCLSVYGGVYHFNHRNFMCDKGTNIEAFEKTIYLPLVVNNQYRICDSEFPSICSPLITAKAPIKPQVPLTTEVVLTYSPYMVGAGTVIPSYKCTLSTDQDNTCTWITYINSGQYIFGSAKTDPAHEGLITMKELKIVDANGVTIASTDCTYGGGKTCNINLINLQKSLIAGQYTISTTIKGIPVVCGNGAIESGETCDGSNLNGMSCSSLGFVSGTLTCNQNCILNIDACSSAPSTPVPSIPPASTTNDLTGDVLYYDYGRQQEIQTTTVNPGALYVQYRMKNNGQTTIIIPSGVAVRSKVTITKDGQFFSEGTNYISDTQLSSVRPGESTAMIPISFFTISPGTGTYCAELNVDDLNRLLESDESNNIVTKCITVT